MSKCIAEFAQLHGLVWWRQYQFRRSACPRHQRHRSLLLFPDLFTYNRMAHKGPAAAPFAARRLRN
jgi:hypothetical protein